MFINKDQEYPPSIFHFLKSGTILESQEKEPFLKQHKNRSFKRRPDLNVNKQIFFFAAFTLMNFIRAREILPTHELIMFSISSEIGIYFIYLHDFRIEFGD